jgi:hypothetical protein
MVGNFPQAFSHIALTNSANNIWEHHKPAEQRSGHVREPRGGGHMQYMLRVPVARLRVIDR